MRIFGILVVCNVLSIAILVNSKLIEEAEFPIHHYSEKLSTKQDFLENEYASLTDNLTAWKKRINQKLLDLKDAKRELMEEKDELVKEVKRELTYQLAQVLPTVDAVEEKVDALELSLQRNNDQINRTLQASLNGQQLRVEAHSEKHNHPPIIAFSARTPTTTAGKYEIIPFFKTLLNTGDTYDNTTGIFTAPVQGIYRFTLQISPKHNKVFSAQLTVDKSSVIGTLRHRSDYTDGVSSSASGVARLNAGDTVGVTNLLDDTYTISTEEDHWSSFSGFLMHAL